MQFHSEEMLQTSNEKVAWIRAGALGDLLVALAALEETCQRHPSAQIWVVGNSLWREILQPGFYTQIVGLFILDDKKATTGEIYDLREGQWQKSGQRQSLKEFLKGFQKVINLRIDTLRFAWPAIVAGVPERMGSAAFPTSLVYTHTVPWLGKDPIIHERDAALRVLGGQKSFIPKKSALAEEIVEKWQIRGGLPPTKKFDQDISKKMTGQEWKTYWLINPTASKREKAWRAENFRKLALELRTLSKEKILIIGSPQESDWLKEVAGNEFSIVQPTNIQILMDIVAGAKALLTNTSSMQFIAASCSTPTITIMGKARPEIWGPLGREDEIVRGRFQAPAGASPDEIEVIAYNSVSVKDVLTKVNFFI